MAYGTAIQAKEMAREELPNTTIEVSDSQVAMSSQSAASTIPPPRQK